MNQNVIAFPLARAIGRAPARRRFGYAGGKIVAAPANAEMIPLHETLGRMQGQARQHDRDKWRESS
jgi:hypothetical protein